MSRWPIALIAAAGALALLACGDGGPASPSDTQGVTVRGVLLREDAALTGSSREGSSGEPITVVVEGTSLGVTISGNGTFEIEDIPAGPFTLVFLQGGVGLGRIEFTAVDGARIRIVVEQRGSVIVLAKMGLDDEDDDTSDAGQGHPGAPSTP